MSLSKIPDKVLGKLQCVQCAGYLSVAPIGVRADGQSICGRCTNHAGPESVARCKLFEELASLHSFPCSFQLKGCPEYIQFDKVLDHENKCFYRSYHCPVSHHAICNWMGAVSQICKHYQDHHPALYLQTADSQLSLQDCCEVYNVVEVNRVAFLLQTKYEKEKKKIWFNVIRIGDAGDESPGKYRVKLSGESTGGVMVTEIKSPSPITRMHMVPGESLEVGVDSLMSLLRYPEIIHCQWLFFNASHSRLEIYNQATTNLTKCPNCNLPIIPPIYRCPVSHVTCLDCMDYKDKCGVCRESNLKFTRAIDLEEVAHSAQFQCKWNNCSEVLGCSMIRAHQQTCPQRIYTCPYCTEHIGLIDSVHQHFQVDHPEISFEEVQGDTRNFSVKTASRYVLAHNELFKVDVVRGLKALWKVYFTFCGPRSMATYFRYEVRDRYNVLYYASKCSTKRYKASTKMTYCTSRVRSEYYLTIRFNKHSGSDVWMPIDSPTENGRRN